MRYDTPIYFQKTISGQYNADTGDYEGDSVKETMRYGNIRDTGADMLTLVYGNICQQSLTIQLQNHYSAVFDRIRIGKKLYKADFMRKLRTKHVLVVSEVQ